MKSNRISCFSKTATVPTNTLFLTDPARLVGTYGQAAADAIGAKLDALVAYLNANPQFVSTTTPDLHVASSSPAVNAGINLGSSVVGTLDFAGNTRVQGANIDIGAYEQ